MPATSLNFAVAFPAFGVFVRFNDSVSHLNQQRFQIVAGAREAGRFHFLVALVILRAATGLGNQMFCGGKYRHIHTDFGDERNRCQRSGREPRNRTDQFQLLRIRFGKPKDLGFYMLPVFIELVDVQQAFLELGSLFTGYRAVHSGLNFFNRMLAVPVNKRGNVKLLTGMI